MSEVELERELAAGRRAREQIVRAVERGDARISSPLQCVGVRFFFSAFRASHIVGQIVRAFVDTARGSRVAIQGTRAGLMDLAAAWVLTLGPILAQSLDKHRRPHGTKTYGL